MLTKIFITLFIVIGAVVYLRRGRGKKVPLASDNREQPPLRSKVVIYTTIALSMLVTAGYWCWSWYDDNTVVQVTISSPIEAMTASYQVRKKDIKEQRITTIDGIQIRLSSQERLTVKPLATP